MDFIPFEKVSVQEAKAVADGPAAKKVEPDWAATRGKDAKNTDLSEKGWQWLDALPQDIQPGGLVQQFPRIASKLADMWNRPHQCERYLDALMLDNRGSRKGFPLDVTVELARLKDYYLNTVVTQRFDAWGHRIN
jgi:hypothetical protein